MSTDPESIAEDLSSKIVCVLSMMCPLLSSPSNQHSESDSRGNLSAALMGALALIIRHPRNHAAAQVCTAGLDISLGRRPLLQLFV